VKVPAFRLADLGAVVVLGEVTAAGYPSSVCACPAGR